MTFWWHFGRVLILCHQLTKGTHSNNRLEVRIFWPPSRFPASKTISNAMTGFIITKYHELIRFFIKNFTRMSLKLEKPEKIRISFKCYLYINKKKFLESPRHANGYQYAIIYLFHAFHDHFTLYIIGEETFTSYGPMGTCSSLSAHCASSEQQRVVQGVLSPKGVWKKKKSNASPDD